MNYYTLRIISFILLLLVLLILFRFVIRKKINNEKTYNRIKIITLSIILLVCWYFPYESTIIKFDTAEQSFHYYFPRGKIIKEYTIDKNKYILYSDSGSENFICYEFLNNNWIFLKSKTITKTYNKYLITINEVSSKNISGIIISYPNTDEEVLIKDSLDNKFEKMSQQDIFETTTFDTLYTMVNQQLDDDYTIYFEELEYKPLK